MKPDTERLVSRWAMIVTWCAWGGLIVFVVRGRGADGLRNLGAGRTALLVVFAIALATAGVLRVRATRRRHAADQLSTSDASATESAQVVASFRGGARFEGGLNYSWPLAKLVVKHGVVELSVPFMSTQRFKLANVQRAAPHTGMFGSPGVKFEWSGEAPSIIFWTRNPSAVVSELRRAGYRGA